MRRRAKREVVSSANWPASVQSCPAPPCSNATRKPDVTRRWYFRFLDPIGFEYSRTCLAWRGFTETKKRRSTSQQPGKQSASRPSDKPLTNRLSTGDFVPAFGLHWISLVRASGETFKQYVLDALDLGGSEGGLFPGRTVLSASSSDRPSPVAPLCAPSRHARGMFRFWTRRCDVVRCDVMWRSVLSYDMMWCDVMRCDVTWCDIMWRDAVRRDAVWCDAMSCHVMWCGATWCGVPGHALHEKGLQRQASAGTLVSIQERRALLVPGINHLWTGYAPVVNRGFCSSIGWHRVSIVRASREIHFSIIWRVRSAVFPWASCAARPGPALPSRHPPPRANPPVVYPGFRFDKWCDVRWCDVMWCDVVFMWCHVLSCHEI